MLQTVALYVSLALFSCGMAYKGATWLRRSIDGEMGRIPTARRVAAAGSGIARTLFSRKALTLLEVFLLDGLLQRRLLRQDFFRWFIHTCIYVGFTMLFLMHAMNKLITSELFPSYYSTLNPFLFLRDLFGGLAFMGILLAVYRRFLRKGPRPVTNAMDIYALAIVAVILGSGFLLEGVKITSYSLYREMVDEYAGPQDRETLEALEAYWVEEFAVASPNLKGPFAPETLERGKTFHETSCAECHAKAAWAFVGYATAKTVSPLASLMDRADMRTVLLYVHFLSCYLGLAYLPFSKMLHMFAAPASLMLNAVMDGDASDPANVATRQMIELDGCTHCGACTLRCRVAVAFLEIPNVNILPSGKLASIRRLAARKEIGSGELKAFQQGMHICTNCDRCTVICPVGINLQQIWVDTRNALALRSLPEFTLLSPLSIYDSLTHDSNGRGPVIRLVDKAREAIAEANHAQAYRNRLTPIVPEPKENGHLPMPAEVMTAAAFSNCYRCMTCSSSCPVVRNYPNPMEILGLMPHQLMHAVGLGLWDLVFSSRMLWDCLGCYQCQQHCPMGVNVTDIIYELKTQAILRTTARSS